VYIPDAELHEAASPQESVALLSRYGDDARLLAGGTDLLVDLKTGRVGARHLVSISGVEALKGVSEKGDGLRIGALTTVTQLDEAPVVRDRYAALRDATQRMAAPQVRNLATVGGNIASAVPCADLPPILTAMNASVTLWSSNGEREVPLDAFFTGPRQTVARRSELLTAVHVPKPPPGFGAAYARFQLRDANTIAVAAVAASIVLEDGGTVQDARIVLGAVSPTPKLAAAAGAALIGRSIDDGSVSEAATAAMEAADPISDVRGSAEFRREVVGVLTRRAIDTARQRALGDAKEGRP
jgi:carbon-monoxide dehydrogenase medium subunit